MIFFINIKIKNFVAFKVRNSAGKVLIWDQEAEKAHWIHKRFQAVLNLWRHCQQILTQRDTSASRLHAIFRDQGSFQTVTKSPGRRTFHTPAINSKWACEMLPCFDSLICQMHTSDCSRGWGISVCMKLVCSKSGLKFKCSWVTLCPHTLKSKKEFAGSFVKNCISISIVLFCTLYLKFRKWELLLGFLLFGLSVSYQQETLVQFCGSRPDACAYRRDFVRRKNITNSNSPIPGIQMESGPWSWSLLSTQHSRILFQNMTQNGGFWQLPPPLDCLGECNVSLTLQQEP